MEQRTHQEILTYIKCDIGLTIQQIFEIAAEQDPAVRDQLYKHYVPNMSCFSPEEMSSILEFIGSIHICKNKNLLLEEKRVSKLVYDYIRKKHFDHFRSIFGDRLTEDAEMYNAPPHFGKELYERLTYQQECKDKGIDYDFPDEELVPPPKTHRIKTIHWKK